MNSNKKRGLAVIFTLAVISILIYSGSVKAITIGISDLVSTLTGSNTVSFLAKVDLHTNDIILSSAVFTVTMTGGTQNYTCVFDIDGNKLSACPNVNITLQSSNLGAASLGGSLYGYGYSSIYNTSRTNFTSAGGYGYAYSAGYGYDTYNTSLSSTAELIYNITWLTPTVEENTTYTVDLSANLTDGTNTVNYVTLDTNKGTITLVSAEQAASDAATVSAVANDLTYALILMDDNKNVSGSIVIGDLYLPTSMGTVSITWSSDASSVINTTGGVTRPAQNTSVLLTASLTKGSATSTKFFYLRVKKAASVSAPDADGEVNASDNEIILDLTTIQNTTSILASKTLDEDEIISLNLADLKNATGHIKLLDNNFTLKRQTSAHNYTADIRNGTVISGGSNWNGLINLPTVKTSSSYTPPSGSANVVVDMGSGIELNFSQAVKITLGGMAGKRASWTRGNTTLIDITTQCNSATNPTNIDSTTTRECYIDSGSDLIIWTYHFTIFAAYTPPTTDEEESTTTYTSGTSWDCEEWSECVDGYKTRTCTYQDKEKTVRTACDDSEGTTTEEDEETTEEDEEEIIVEETTEEDEEETTTESKPTLEQIKESMVDMVWIYIFVGLVIVAIIILLVELKRNQGFKF
jgi:hypothetical protein